jgi:hypothetical protein
MIIFSILSGLMVATLLMVNIYIVKGLAEVNDETTPEVIIATTPPSAPVLTTPTVVEKPKRKKKDVKDSGNS